MNNFFKYQIKLRRSSGYGIKVIMIPSTILWMLAYLTLCLDVEDFTNRNRISVTVLLCLTSFFGTLLNKTDFPKTTEFKYIDLWFLWYLTNVFLINCHHLLIDKVLRISKNSYLNPTPSMVILRDENQSTAISKTSKNVNLIALVFFLGAMTLFNTIYYAVAT